MRLIGFGAENFLSFGEFSWRDLDPRLNIIVGPNGAGKTNLIRLARAAADVPEGGRDLWQRAGRNGADFFRFWLDLELTEERERDLLRAFLHAAFCDEGKPETVRRQFARPERWVEWVDSVLKEGEGAGGRGGLPAVPGSAGGRIRPRLLPGPVRSHARCGRRGAVVGPLGTHHGQAWKGPPPSWMPWKRPSPKIRITVRRSGNIWPAQTASRRGCPFGRS